MTTRVIQETLRVASILSFTFREAVEDVEYEGQSPAAMPIPIPEKLPFLLFLFSYFYFLFSRLCYRETEIEIFFVFSGVPALSGYLIPKGWKVLPLFRNIHHSPDIFPEPEKFDPSRFEVAPKPNTFMPFGSGTHACPGNELAKMEMLVLLHHLTTKYR